MSHHLSILDKIYVPEGGSAVQALHDSVVVAQLAERLNYRRYWFAEHHALPQLASSAPEILVAHVLAKTSRIRVGSGGVMLRHYAPYKVAETFNLLASLAPDRVDLGIGKAPGGLLASTRALAEGRDGTFDYDAQVIELEGFLSNSLPAEHRYADALATPVPAQPAQRFLLGASAESASLAARLDWQFVYAGHFDGDPGHIERAFEAYRRHSNRVPLLAVIAFAANSSEEATRLLSALRIYKLHLAPGHTINLTSPEQAAEYARQAGVSDYRVEETRPSVLSGDAGYVHGQLEQLQRRFGVEEFIVETPITDLAARSRSLELLAPSPRTAVAA